MVTLELPTSPKGLNRFLVHVSSETRKPGYHIAWKTVTYRSVALLIMAGVGLFLIAVRLTFPQFTENSLKAAGSIANKALEREAGFAPAAGRERLRWREGSS